ncbi:MAG TPA: hypothetical protein VLF09_01230 [Cellvibrio sp.]|nr:hypothetical protein [Cellvibrio sp.]
MFVVILIVVSYGLAAIGLYVALIIDAAICVGRYNRKLVERVIKERAALSRQLVTVEESAQ